MIVEVTETTQVAEARRAAGDLARRESFDETDAGRVAIVATELATNLLKHGGGGEVGAVSVPYPGEPECGDGWARESGEGSETLLVVDGSGHGAAAASASAAAIRYFRAHAGYDLTTLAQGLHRALAPTRGAA